MTIKKNDIDSDIEKGVVKFKELNPFPADLHARIMQKLDNKAALPVKDSVDNAIEAGFAKYKTENTYPVNLHVRIMEKLDEKKVIRISWNALLPRAAVALVCLLVAVFAGSKMLERQKTVIDYQIPVAVVLSLESQAGLIKADLGNAIDDSINTAIFNMEQTGS